MYAKNFKKTNENDRPAQRIYYENKTLCNPCNNTGVIVVKKGIHEFAYRCTCESSKNFEGLPAQIR